MLKDYGYGGVYRDGTITVSVMIENPAAHGLEPASLVFNVQTSAKGGGNKPQLANLTFYLLDENNRLYNTQTTPFTKVVKANTGSNDMVPVPDGLIYTELKPEFLFQDLRLAFYYSRYDRMEIIKLALA